MSSKYHKIIEPIIFLETMYRKKLILYGGIIIGVIKEGVLTEAGAMDIYGRLNVLLAWYRSLRYVLHNHVFMAKKWLKVNIIKSAR